MHTNFMQVMDGQSHINKSQTTIVFIMENKKNFSGPTQPHIFYIIIINGALVIAFGSTNIY